MNEQNNSHAQDEKERVTAIVLSAVLGKADGETYGASHARKMNEERADKAAERILALRTPAACACLRPGGDPLGNCEECSPADGVSPTTASYQSMAQALEASEKIRNILSEKLESRTKDLEQALAQVERLQHQNDALNRALDVYRLAVDEQPFAPSHTSTLRTSNSNE